MRTRKAVAKAVLRTLVRQLPWGARGDIFDELLQGDRTRFSRHFAERLNVTGFIVDGECGPIQGSPLDQSILPVYAATRKWASATTSLFVDFFKPTGGTYLDIGGNIGLTTIPVARNPSVRCITFEPEPANFANLADNLRRNCPHGNVQPRQLALFDRNGMLPFALAEANLGDHQVILSGSSATRRKVIDVPAGRLDDQGIEITGPLGVKIDTQGAEPFVVSGGRETLRRAGLIVMEFSPYQMAQMGGDPEILLDFAGSFREAAIATAEAGEKHRFRDAKSAVSELRRAVRRFSDDGAVYFDVILR
jgi:FkbM family methyltransferase